MKAPVAQRGFPAPQRQRSAEQRSPVTERMKLAALAAGIDPRRQGVEQGIVERLSAEGGIELLRLDAAERRAMPLADETAGERRGVLAPERKDRPPSLPAELAHAIVAHVREEQIAERTMPHAGPAPSCLGQRACLRRFVGLVRVRPVQLRLEQRQTEGVGLRKQHVAPRAMHGDALVGAVDGRKQADRMPARLAQQVLQRHQAVLAAAPRQQDRNRLHGGTLELVRRFRVALRSGADHAIWTWPAAG